MATKGEDCYFFYNAKCAKGDKCPYRHCVAALASSTVCTLWLQGSCFRATCPFRHMIVNPPQNEIPCYFESQLTGCLKPNCPFKHFKPRNVSSVGTNSVAMASTTQPAVGVVQPTVPKGQATIPETLQQEGKSLSIVLASPVGGQRQSMTTPAKNDSFSFDLSKLTPSNPMPFAVQPPTTLQNKTQVSNKATENGNGKEFNQQTPILSKETVLAAKKKARAERFGLKTQSNPALTRQCHSPAVRSPTMQQDIQETKPISTIRPQPVSSPSKTVSTAKRRKISTGGNGTAAKSESQAKESGTLKTGIQKIVWDLGRKKETLSVDSAASVSDKPKAGIQEIKWDVGDTKISVSGKPKVQVEEIKWDLDDKKMGLTLGSTLLGKATRKRSISGGVKESYGQTENGREKGQEVQTGTAVKKIKLVAKVSPAAPTIMVKSFDEIMREKRQKRQKQLSAAQSTVQGTSPNVTQAVSKKQRKSETRVSVDIARQPDSTVPAAMSTPRKSGSTPDSLQQPAVSSIDRDVPQVESQAKVAKDDMNSTVSPTISTTTEEREKVTISSDDNLKVCGDKQVSVDQESMIVEHEIKSPIVTAGYVALRRISSKVREDHDSLLDAELEQMLGGLSGSDMEDNMDGSKDDDDLILDIEEFVNS